MNDVHYLVSTDVFAKYPGYVRGIMLAYGLTNGPSPDDLVSELRAAEEGLRQRLALAGLAEHPRIRAWREAFRAFGAKPGDFRSSIEAMTRRGAAWRATALHQHPRRYRKHRVLALPGARRRPCHRRSDRGPGPSPGRRDGRLRGPRFRDPRASGTGRDHFRRGQHRPHTPLDLATGARYAHAASTARPSNTTFTVCRPSRRLRCSKSARRSAGLVKQYCGGRTRIELLSAGSPRISLKE